MPRKNTPLPSYLSPLKDRKVGETQTDVFGEEAAIEKVVQTQVQPSRDVAYQDIDVRLIRPNPFQARTDFDQEDAQEDIRGLAASIRQHGFIGTLTVRPDPDEEGFYQLAFGERRWRAAQLVPEVKTIPCRVGLYINDQMEDIGLIENVQRRDLNPLDEAVAFQKKMEKVNPHTGAKYSIRTLAEHLGLKRHRIEEPLRLVNIPTDVQQMVRKRSDTERVAFEIAKLPTAELRKPLIHEILQKSMNTREVIKTVDAILAQLHNLQEQPQEMLAHSAKREKKNLPSADSAVLFTKDALSIIHPEPSEQEISSRSGTIFHEQEEQELSKSLSEAFSEKSIWQSKREKRIRQDSQTISEILHRWSNWISKSEVEPADLVTYVVGWSAELDELKNRVKLEQ